MSLVVEDGTGLITAEAYESVANADTFLSTYYSGDSDYSSWFGASTSAKETGLRWGALYIDLKYGPVLMGHRVLKAQALEFPRYQLVSPDGYSIDIDSVPLDVRRANVLLAYRQVVGDTLLGDLTADDATMLRRKNVEIGSIQIFKEYIGGQENFKRYTVVEMLMNPFSIGGGSMSPVSRG